VIPHSLKGTNESCSVLVWKMIFASGSHHLRSHFQVILSSFKYSNMAAKRFEGILARNE